MKTKLVAAVAVLLLAAPFSYAGGKKDPNAAPKTQGATAKQPAYFTGDGGKGRSITILPPRGVGLAENQAYLPDFVANELVSNFNTFSAMTPFDRVNNQKQYDELLSGFYADNNAAGLDLGHLSSTDYMLLGDITRTSTGYALQLSVNSNSDKKTVAAYSGTVAIAELDDLSGVRRASLDLLQKMGVQVTERTRTELVSAAAASHVNAQTALARGITAQRQGTEVAALSYFFQAAAFDPSLLEAANRGSVMNASITSGNIGDNVRNDIQWRRDWVARLTSTEQYFDSFFKESSLPYTLFYSTAINQGKIDYTTETVTLSMDVNLRASGVWIVSVERALQAVYQGLDATTRKGDWGLANWPGTGVTSLRPFAAGNKTFTVAAELLNERNQVIGRQNINVKGDWRWQGVTMRVSDDDIQTVNFTVKAEDITDRMTIRIAGVNGVDAQTAARNGVLQTRALSGDEWSLYLTYTLEKGIITPSSSNMRSKDITIPAAIWGEPVTAIESSAFYDKELTSVTIPNSVTSIGYGAFWNNNLTSVIIPNSVTFIGDSAFSYNRLTSVTIGNSVKYIGDGAFKGNRLRSVTIPNSVTSIGKEAFHNNGLISVTIGNGVTTIGDSAFYSTELISVTIGANVSIGRYAFSGGFELAYNNNGKRAGKYEYMDGKWTYKPSDGVTSAPVPAAPQPDPVKESGKFQYTERGGITITGYTGSTKNVKIPEKINGSPVTSIGAGAFSGKQLNRITIPNSVTSIGREAFSGNWLTRITIGANLRLDSACGFEDYFIRVYNENDRKAGTYTRDAYNTFGGRWYKPFSLSDLKDM